MTVILAPLWEVWNWGDSDVTFFAVVFLLFGAYGAGYQSGLGKDRAPPPWVIVAFVAATIAVVVLIAQYGGCDDPGGCDPPDDPY